MSAPLPADPSRIDPAEAWQPWRPDANQPFDRKWAGHLFRRAAFGAGPDAIQAAARDGLDATLDRLFAGDPKAPSRAAMLDDTGEQIARDDDPNPLRAWWVYVMLRGGHPLREKLTLFWHNHFATSVAKVRSPLLMVRQNRLLRAHALGKFGPLLAAVSRDPAMLVWLDSNENVKAHPNENFAREVMELFTLGVGHYSEKDVREAARAFTGWHVNGDGDGFEWNRAEFDPGPKTVLGRTGPWEGDDVLHILLAQPACARFLAAKLYRFYVSETDPPKGLLDPLADQLRKTDYDIAAAVRTVLRSRLFFSDHAYRKRVKSPVEYVLGTVRAAWPGPFAPADLVGPLEAMGQQLFAPPNVKGWTGGKSWLTDATLLARHNFAERVCANPPAPPPPAPTGPLPATAPAPPMVDPLPPIPKIESKAGRDGLERVGIDFTAATGPVPKEGDAPVPPGTPGPPPREVPDSKAPPIAMPLGKEAPPPPGAMATAGTDSIWYVHKAKAKSPADIVRAIGEQFLPGGLPERVARRLETFLGKEPVPDARVREAIHAVLCLPEYQLC